MTKFPVGVHVAWIVAIVIVVGGANLLWTSHAVRVDQQQSSQVLSRALQSNDRAWCTSLGLLTSGPEPPASQVEARKLRIEFRKLEQRFGCDR